METGPVDAEFVALIQNVHKDEIAKHIYRGYSLLQKGDNNLIGRESNSYSGEKRALWFVFGGMESQWSGMGASLMQIPVFVAAIKKCDSVLRSHGVDIVSIISANDPKMFDNLINLFVCISAIQIGLVDILNVLGIVPDYIIGHSIGELGCAYADGCLTAEETILSAYFRAVACLETKLIRCTTADVRLSYNDICKFLPPEIDVACHKSGVTSTISGPPDVVNKFVRELQSKGIRTSKLNGFNLGYHSRYIADAGPSLLNKLENVIKKPKARSPKWISSSVPDDRKHSDLAKYSSADYHTNNLLSAVLFEEASQKIHSNAIAIEIGSYGPLQAVLGRSSPSRIVNIPLTQRGKNNTNFLLQAIGK